MVGDQCCTYVTPSDDVHVNISEALEIFLIINHQIYFEEHGGQSRGLLHFTDG